MRQVRGPGASARTPPSGRTSSGGLRSAPAVVASTVVLVGLVVSGALSWAAWTSNRHNEERLLRVQAKQAAAVLEGTILGLTDPLRANLLVAAATGADATRFRAGAQPLVGPTGLFETVLLLRTDGLEPVGAPVAGVGAAPLLDPSSGPVRAILARAARTKAFAVAPVGRDRVERVAYAVADPGARLVVYAERAIPPDRLVPAVRSPAFANLDFATYIGPTTDAAALATTDVPLADLPLTGTTTRETVRFGDTVLTLVARRSRPLGGPLGERLPGVLLAAGLLLTGVTATAAARSVAHRRRAEADTATIGALYAELDGLYGEQRGIAQALQHALLPRRHPDVSAIEISSRYVAGARGVDVGGDWFSVIALDGGRFGFVIGDVSGKGVEAATVMARLRFTLRAYLVEGHAPDRVLDMTAEQIDLVDDGHFATALVGVADARTGEVRIANAGHLEPLVVHGDDATFLPTKVGPPLGVDVGAHPVTEAVVPPGGTLLLFTDGLVERRTEDLDEGLRRLAAAAVDAAVAGHDPAVQDLVDAVVARLVPQAADDDVAVLAVRWLPATDG